MNLGTQTSAKNKRKESRALSPQWVQIPSSVLKLPLVLADGMITAGFTVMDGGDHMSSLRTWPVVRVDTAVTALPPPPWLRESALQPWTEANNRLSGRPWGGVSAIDTKVSFSDR